MRPEVTVRRAASSDLPAIAEIHVKSWQQAYKGLIDQAYLDSLDVAKRLAVWHDIFAKQSEPGFNIFVAEINGTIIGFLSTSPPESENGDVYIGAVYLLQNSWSQGAGYKLFTRALEAFRAANFTRPYLWVLDTNALAINAYRRWGGKVVPGVVKESARGDTTLREICIIF